MKSLLTSVALAALGAPALAANVELGPRPGFLIDQMEDGDLKDTLAQCADMDFQPSAWSIGHRGAPMQFPEHTVESYKAAARMGAGVLECDVAFTADKELVCRHAQDDLATTTNILATDLGQKCTAGFTPASGDTPAGADCRTSDLTLEEFKSLEGKMDAGDDTATDIESFMDATAGWRTDLYSAQGGTLMTHAESIALFKELGTKFTPELKSPAVEMPFDGFSQEDYAQKLIDEYKAAGVPAEDVFPQSFNLADVLYWIEAEPEYGAQAVYLVEWPSEGEFDEQDPATWSENFEELKAQGVNYLAPSMNMLVTNADGTIAASEYAKAAKAAGLNLISWTLERSGPLTTGGGWYYTPLNDMITSDGQMFELVDVLAQDVGVVGLFSDWPATTTYYANCMGLN
ncbi:glycerophosphodiester phosphodiesterase family protein [Amaricoccus macauensis]|uniref:glycerophosphodiester phosphodiesterase family protein n=1 Tax=Amaricoccus macauensis TaxID=57001 RepID=UPI003C7C4692